MSGSGQKFIGRNRAPRVQIEYDVETGGAMRKIELPFVMSIMSDLKGKAQEGEELTPVAEREFESIDISSFEKKMKSIKPRATFQVDNKLGEDGGQLPIDLTFTSMRDFSPAAVAEQVPELKKLYDTRNQLKALLSFMDGKLAAENTIKELLENESLMKSLAGPGAPEEPTKGEES